VVTLCHQGTFWDLIRRLLIQPLLNEYQQLLTSPVPMASARWTTSLRQCRWHMGIGTVPIAPFRIPIVMINKTNREESLSAAEGSAASFHPNDNNIYLVRHPRGGWLHRSPTGPLGVNPLKRLWVPLTCRSVCELCGNSNKEIITRCLSSTDLLFQS
jgi:hypothetical protein